MPGAPTAVQIEEAPLKHALMHSILLVHPCLMLVLLYALVARGIAAVEVEILANVALAAQ